MCLLDKLDLSVKFRFETRSLHDSLHKKYQYAARFVDLIASKTVKIVYYSLIAKCTFMENQPPNSTISFKNGDLVVIDVRNGKISITLSGELFVIGLNNGVVPDKCSSIFKHARECLVKCLEIEGKSSKFPITVRADESKNLDTCCTRVFLDRIGWCCKFSGQLGGDLYIVLFDDGASLEIESKLKTLVYKIASVEERYTIDRDLPLHVKERLNAFPKFIKMF